MTNKMPTQSLKATPTHLNSPVQNCLQQKNWHKNIEKAKIHLSIQAVKSNFKNIVYNFTSI